MKRLIALYVSVDPKNDQLCSVACPHFKREVLAYQVVVSCEQFKTDLKFAPHDYKDPMRAKGCLTGDARMKGAQR